MLTLPWTQYANVFQPAKVPPIHQSTQQRAIGIFIIGIWSTPTLILVSLMKRRRHDLESRVIDLGTMGSVIAYHLLKQNFNVIGYDILLERGAKLEKAGLKIQIL